jgi:hypothetical protein
LSGAAVTVSWDAPPGRHAQDWAALYPIGGTWNTYGDWEYTGGGQSGAASLSVSGIVTGLFEPRYLLENHYTAVASGETIAVGGGAGVFALTGRPWFANLEENLVATWSAPPGQSATDWVGLFAVGESDNHNDLGRAYTNGDKNGVFTVVAPTTPGQYEFRYLRNDCYTDLVATSNTIQVGTVERQFHVDGQGSVQALTRKSWGSYKYHLNQYWTDAWGNTNAPVDSGNPFVYCGNLR